MSETLTATASATINCSAIDVCRAWIDPEILPQWLAPPPYNLVRAEVDPCIGGNYCHHIIGPDGEHMVTGQYLVVAPGQQILKAWNYSGPNHAPRPESTYVRVNFAEETAKFAGITIEHYGLRDSIEQKHYQDGWALCLKRLKHLYASSSITCCEHE